jgi:heat shock protein HslJ
VLSVTFGSDGDMDGSSGCNTFQGTYVVQPLGTSQGGITITLGPSTTMICPDDIMTQEQAILTALVEATAYHYPPKGLLFALLDSTGTEILSGELQ